MTSLADALTAIAEGREIEPAWTRGEWATRAEVTWRSKGRTQRRRVTYSVIHVPSNRIVESFLSRSDARALVRWLARDVPHITVGANRVCNVIPVEPEDARQRLITILGACREARHAQTPIACAMEAGR